MAVTAFVPRRGLQEHLMAATAAGRVLAWHRQPNSPGRPVQYVVTTSADTPPAVYCERQLRGLLRSIHPEFCAR